MRYRKCGACCLGRPLGRRRASGPAGLTDWDIYTGRPSREPASVGPQRQAQWLSFLREVVSRPLDAAPAVDSPAAVALWRNKLRPHRRWTDGGAFRPDGLRLALSIPGAPHPADAAPALTAFAHRRAAAEGAAAEGTAAVEARAAWAPSAVTELLSACVLRVHRIVDRSGQLCLPGRPVWEELQKGRKLFDWIRAEGLPLTLRGWTRAVQLQSHLRQSASAIGLVREMVCARVNPDQHVAVLVLVSHRANRATCRPEIAARLRSSVTLVWRQFAELGVVPDRAMYDTLVQVRASLGDDAGALAVHEAMRRDGLRPDPSSYAALLGTARTALQVQDLLRRMAEEDVPVDAKAYEAVMTALRTADPVPGRVGTADARAMPRQLERVMDTARTQGLTPTAAMWSALLCGYRDAADVAGAVDAFRRMASAESGVSPTPGAVAQVFSCCERAAQRKGDDATRAAEWLAELCRRHPELANEWCWSHRMRMHLNVRDPQSAVAAFRELKQSGARVTTDHLGLAHEAYVACGEQQRAAEIARIPGYRAAVSRRHAYAARSSVLPALQQGGGEGAAAPRGILPEEEPAGADGATEALQPSGAAQSKHASADELAHGDMDGLETLGQPRRTGASSPPGEKDSGHLRVRHFGLGMRGSTIAHQADGLDWEASIRRAEPDGKRHCIDDVLEQRLKLTHPVRPAPRR
eukprot:TRINITY_DN21558_c0_g1_i1.p1 TRINITY_DN21558_c0_g1~~TRINITY_DN21558_c0_g1_i1.p1  ORF type:complete len:711 (+),score=181.54 TRINITY_DN21558_c0_g1_i1:52-2133(+)